MQNQVETKHVPLRQGAQPNHREGTRQSPNGVVVDAPEDTYKHIEPEQKGPAQSPLAERLEKMQEGVRNLKAQRDGLRAEIASRERDLEQVNDAVKFNEGALAMIQQLVQEEGLVPNQREGGR